MPLLTTRSLLLAAGTALVLTGRLAAQNQEWDARRMYASRADLDRLAQRMEAAAASPAYSEVLRGRARDQATQIRRRLDQGDFQAGDRVILEVEPQTAMSDTFVVAAGPKIVIPTVGEVSLRGVLRSELEDHLREQVARFVINPVVRTRTMVRISILGEVASPGFYSVPSEMLVSDAVMRAGGWSASANLSDIRLDRGGAVVIDAVTLQNAITEGRTLDQLDVRAGDQFVVGKRRGSFVTEGGLRTLFLLAALPASVAGLLSLF